MSKFAQRVLRYYDAGLWTRSMVMAAYEKGKLTDEELVEILGAPDNDGEADPSSEGAL